MTALCMEGTLERALGMLFRDEGNRTESGRCQGEGHESEKWDLAKREETSLVAQRLGTRLPVQETRV